MFLTELLFWKASYGHGPHIPKKEQMSQTTLKERKPDDSANDSGSPCKWMVEAAHFWKSLSWKGPQKPYSPKTMEIILVKLIQKRVPIYSGGQQGGPVDRVACLEPVRLIYIHDLIKAPQQPYQVYPKSVINLFFIGKETETYKMKSFIQTHTAN